MPSRGTRGSKGNDDPYKKAMVKEAKKRAKRQGVPFNLTEADIHIPKRCPVLGIPLAFNKGRAQHNSPSLDKIIPRLGYVPGNVVVMSNRANRLKNDATFSEIEKLYEWTKKISKKKAA